MVIVKFQGGIGNQLFEYAFYKELQYLGKEVYADFSAYKNEHQIRELELNKVGLVVEEVPRKVLSKMGQSHETFFDKIVFRLYGKKRIVKDEYGQVFSRNFLELDNVFLDGYWQTKKYFEDVFQEVIEEIDFEKNLDEENRRIANEMSNCDSISIHMRFGDYVGNNLYSGICTPDYYKKAIEYIKNQISNPKFYVITDDEMAAGAILDGEEYEILSNNRGSDSYKDIYLISSCKHHIMANSSFSWWGVMIDRKDNGLVITPNKWLNEIDTKDIWEERWIKI